MTVFRIAVLGLLACLLSACGGGGGGGGGSPAGAAEFRLSLDRSALTFQMAAGGSAPPSQTIVATWTGTPPDPAYVTATVDGVGIAPTIPTRITQSSATATVSAAAGLAAGTYSGRINFLVCRDAACNQPVGGSPLPVNFTVNVAAGAVSTAPISFEYVAGHVMPAPRTVQVANGSGAWSVSASAPWVGVSATGGQGAGSFDVSFLPALATAGVQTASIIVSSAQGTQVIPVSLAMTTPTSGGGGSGGEFMLSPTSVTLSARRAETAPSTSVQLHLQGSQAVNVGAAFVGSAPDWLAVSISGQAPTYMLTLQVTNTDRPVGISSAVLAVGTVDAAGNILETQNLDVTLRLGAALTATAMNVSPSFVLGSSASTSTSSINLTTDSSLSWNVTSNVPWLGASVSSGAGSASIGVTVDAANLDLGSHDGVITIANAIDASNALTIPYRATIVAPTISITSGPVVIGGSDGVGTTGTIALSINTGTHAYPWTATATTASGDAWLAPAASGQVSSASTNIAVDAERTLVDPGRHEGTVSVQINVRGHTYTRSVPIVLNKEGHWLLISSKGAAFSSFPARSVLTRSVQIASSQGRTDVPWSATSDSSWLSVTASGTTGGTLQLTADPAGLPQDVSHFATVTISSSDPEIENQESIRVALWSSATDPQNQSVSGDHVVQIANPVEPWVYANEAFTSIIRVYDVYTGALVHTWNTTLGRVGDMAISQDGTLLFVNDWVSRAIVALDARTGAPVRSYSYSEHAETGGMAYANVGGKPALLTGVGIIYDVATGTRHTSTINAGLHEGPFNFALDSLSGDAYSHERGLSPAPLSRHSIKRTVLNDDGIAVQSMLIGFAGSNAQDLCLSNDGSRLYVASGFPYVFRMFATHPFELLGDLPGIAYPTNTECGWNGIFVGGADAFYDAQDVWVYREDGSLLTSLKMGGTLNTSLRSQFMVLSGDNTRLIGSISAGASTPSLHFKSIPAP